MSDLLNTGKSALFAFQRALSTTSHNIANVNTDGYARQRVEFESRSGDLEAELTIGRGVSISAIERLHDEFANARVSSATSAHAEQDVHYQLASRLDNMVTTDGLSVAPALNNFFNAIQDANADPSSIATREVVLENVQQLADRFISLQGQLDTIRNEVVSRTGEAINTVNQFASSIADINKQIISVTTSLNSQQAHDLRDQRDQLVNKMSEYMEVDTLIQDNGSMSIYIAKGISLVNDGTAQPLEAKRDTLDPDKVQILIGEGASKQELGANIQGGIIGGLNNFADTTLNQARHELGRLALVVADEVNAQHALGVDLNGNPGVDLFAGTDPVVYADSLNNGTATLRGRITDVQAIEATEYLLRYDGANFTATRVSDGVSTVETVPIEIDGIALTISGTPAAGDEFLLSATGRAASSVQTLVSNPDKLALAGQLTTASDIGNISDARISAAKVTDPEDISLTNPVQIVFTSDTAYDIVDSTSGAILVNGAGYIQDDPIALNGWEVSIRGEAKSGDVHTVSPNVIGRGDNSNGISLVNMQTSLLVNGNESFSDAYGSLVSQIGSDTSSTLTRTTALESLRDSAIDRQQTSQGVSLDEEAVNLTRYQQAYQAAAQVITTSETMFQSILGAIQ